ncbi:MAG: hypothetical protein LBC20_11490 [Planctomycetaceae bacterium]|nr:hypothetical protein [Planctomycetaceae bacterium]
MTRIFVFLFFIFLFGFTSLFAQELSEKQRSVADRYAQLEQVLLRMSEASAASNPRRSALLKKVLFASKDKLLALRLKNIVDILEHRQLTEAAAGQETIEQDLLELLQLLENENREQRRTAEKEKIKEILRDLEEIIHQEKNLKSKTAQKENKNLLLLEEEQKKIRLQTQTLHDQITENEHPDTAQSEKTASEEKKENEKNDNEKADPNSDQQSKNQSADQDKNNQDKNNQDENNQNENNQDKNNQNKNNQNKNDQDNQNENDKKADSSQKPENNSLKESSENENKQDNKNDNKNNNDNKNTEQPTGSRTQQAMQKSLHRMNQAEKKLQQAEKNGAVEDQEEAIAELQRAKAELEKILRQLREEELLQTLEKLEARFKRMLRVEQSIRLQTEKIGVEVQNTEESALRPIQIRASQIGVDQQSVIEDADAALVLLREDGTAQAMVESLLQSRFDMTEVKSRLDQTKLDSVTLDIEDAVISVLQEMLDAVELAIKEAEKRKEQQQQSPNGTDGNSSEEPLIQLLSELKMIRSMQQRVNERTKRYEKMIDQLRNEPNADYSTLRKNVEELTRQQNRISRILHDLKIGKAN